MVVVAVGAVDMPVMPMVVMGLGVIMRLGVVVPVMTVIVAMVVPVILMGVPVVMPVMIVAMVVPAGAVVVRRVLGPEGT